MLTRLRDCGIAIILGPKACLMPAWGIAPGIRPTNCLQAPTARFIGPGARLWSVVCCHACVKMARAFSPHFVFRFDTWGVAPGWDECAPLALRRHQPRFKLAGRRE